jgi:hypothetical protein
MSFLIDDVNRAPCSRVSMFSIYLEVAKIAAIHRVKNIDLTAAAMRILSYRRGG